MRLLMGALAAQPIEVVLSGDESLSHRPMERAASPLRAMGAEISTVDGHAPVRIRGKRPLAPIDWDLPVASAQLKSAILIAGLWAEGRTVVRSPGPSRDHTERMLRSMGVAIETVEEGVVLLEGPTPLTGTEVSVPGDFSSAAFFIVAALLGAQESLHISNVGLNPSRVGLLTLLRAMGGRIELENERLCGAEPVADLRVRQSDLSGIGIDDELVALSIDELPAAFIAAALARGTTTVRGAAELRHKECDRLSVMAEGLTALGASVEELPDGLIIEGGELGGGRVDSHGDHRIAMSFAIASLRARSTIEIVDTSPIATSFPGFLETANAVGLNLELARSGGNARSAGPRRRGRRPDGIG